MLIRRSAPVGQLINGQLGISEEASYHERTVQQFISAKTTTTTGTWGRWPISVLDTLWFVRHEGLQAYDHTRDGSGALEGRAGMGVTTHNPGL